MNIERSNPNCYYDEDLKRWIRHKPEKTAQEVVVIDDNGAHPGSLSSEDVLTVDASLLDYKSLKEKI